MILDSSAVVAYFLREVGYERVEALFLREPLVAIGSPTLLELGIVLGHRLGADPTHRLEAFLERFGVVEIPFGTEHRRAAAAAWLRFGKGRHPAALNFGDCCSYATARVAGRPLLFVGDDFHKTDVIIAR